MWVIAILLVASAASGRKERASAISSFIETISSLPILSGVATCDAISRNKIRVVDMSTGLIYTACGAGAAGYFVSHCSKVLPNPAAHSSMTLPEAGETVCQSSTRVFVVLLALGLRAIQAITVLDVAFRLWIETS